MTKGWQVKLLFEYGIKVCCWVLVANPAGLTLQSLRDAENTLNLGCSCFHIGSKRDIGKCCCTCRNLKSQQAFANFVFMHTPCTTLQTGVY